MIGAGGKVLPPRRIAQLMRHGERICRGCGCTDTRACPGGCSWVLLDLHSPTGFCSNCAEDLDWDPRFMASVGFEDG